MIISQDAKKLSTVADVDPTVLQDFSGSYLVGSRWFNQKNGKVFALSTNAVGAAQWTLVAVIPPTNNFAGIIAPTVANDSSQGYIAGSFWFDTVAKVAYVCTDGAVGAAIWTVM